MDRVRRFRGLAQTSATVCRASRPSATVNVRNTAARDSGASMLCESIGTRSQPLPTICASMRPGEIIILPETELPMTLVPIVHSSRCARQFPDVGAPTLIVDAKYPLPESSLGPGGVPALDQAAPSLATCSALCSNRSAAALNCSVGRSKYVMTWYKPSESGRMVRSHAWARAMRDWVETPTP